MALFDFPRWQLTSPSAASGVVAPDERLSVGQTMVMGVQHAVAMFGATVLMPILMGLDPNLAILLSGIGSVTGWLLGEIGILVIAQIYPSLPVAAPWWAVLAALGTSLGTGILFSVWPARATSLGARGTTT